MNRNEHVPELRFEYDEFFGLTERTKWINCWKVEDLNDNEKAILQIVLNYYGKQFDDIENISTSLMKKNSFIQLLVKFKNIDVEELIIIRRINNSKFKIGVESIEEQRVVLVGYITTKHSLYK